MSAGMKTITQLLAAALAVAFVLWYVGRTCNVVVVNDATYDGLHGRWERTPEGQFVFVDELGPYVVMDSLPDSAK